jgi:hypothetical protein
MREMRMRKSVCARAVISEGERAKEEKKSEPRALVRIRLVLPSSALDRALPLKQKKDACVR